MNLRKIKDYLRAKLLVTGPLYCLARVISKKLRVFGTDEKHLALVIPLDGPSADLATQIQIGILEEFGHNPVIEAIPHVTLKMGFSTTDIRPFEKYLSELVLDVAPFDISIRNFGSFEEGILFLDVEPSPALESLRQRIIKDLSAEFGIRPETVEGPEFHYHVTLARDFSKQEFTRLRIAYQTRQIHFKFTARQIDLFYHTGKQWTTYNRSLLLGSNQPTLTNLSNATSIP